MENLVVTLSRQYGSGGKNVARKVADSLGIGFYDKELIAIAAKESGLSETLFENMDEKPTNSILYSLVMGMQSGRNAYYRYGDVLNSDEIFRIQSQVIREIADKEPCVIVGRCADYVLRENPNLINVFIHASEEKKIKRIMDIYDLERKEAISSINKTDKRRGSYYNFYTGQVWGDVNNYHITLDSGEIGVENTAKLIVDYISRRS